MGHRHGLKVFAWMETRNTPLFVPDPQASKARAYSFETGSLEPMPMWSIFDEAVEKGLIGLYEDVARTGIDGILIQDDLVMYQYEDFSAKTAALFEKETGRELDPEALYQDVFQDAQGRWLVATYSDTFWVWARWKNRKLLNLAHKLIQAARHVNPEIQVAMNFMYESVTDPKNALAWLSQSLAEATKLPVDYYAIMAYHRQIEKELELSKAATYDMISSMTATLLKQMDDPHKVVMKVQMCDWETFREIPSREADEVFQRINGQGSVSLAFMPYSPKTPLHIISRHFGG
jgi:biofilm PGA synthesis lipoprotein PgaB